MKKIITLLILIILIKTTKAQIQTTPLVINLTSDTIFTSSFMCTQNTILNGNGYKVEFKGIPKFKPIDCTLMIKNMSVINRKNWGLSYLCNALEWKNIDGMTGYMYNVSSCINITFDKTKFLDGTLK